MNEPVRQYIDALALNPTIIGRLSLKMRFVRALVLYLRQQSRIKTDVAQEQPPIFGLTDIRLSEHKKGQSCQPARKSFRQRPKFSSFTSSVRFESGL